MKSYLKLVQKVTFRNPTSKKKMLFVIQHVSYFFTPNFLNKIAKSLKYYLRSLISVPHSTSYSLFTNACRSTFYIISNVNFYPVKKCMT